MHHIVSDGWSQGILVNEFSTLYNAFSAGLPDPTFTCVLRDAAGTDQGSPMGLYVGTRNGDVYGSADEGEGFALVATQLPDVLCVRAATVED